MAHFFFGCPQGREVAGCVERICCFSPFLNQQRQPDAAATWRWLIGLGYQFPPGVQFSCTLINPAFDPSQRQPSVYCVQKTEPTVARTMVNAPVAEPYGNRGAPSAPPVAGQPRAGAQGMYEQLPDVGLAGGVDPTFGDIDGAGGTYMDIDSNGNEIPRQLSQQAGPPVQQRAHQQ